MMFKKNLVVAVKVDGKVLRESSDRVELPFGSEYSILLKNLDTVRVQAKISIDGKDATQWLIIQPNSDIEVERFVRDLSRGNRFKFIERTESIENYRGIKPEDGLIRVEFRREKVYEAPQVVEHHTYHHYEPPIWRPCRPYRPYWSDITCKSAAAIGSSGLTTTRTLNSNVGQFNVSSSNVNMLGCANTTSDFAFNDTGITVEGSLSNQQFINVNGFETEGSEVIVLHLIGRKDSRPVKVVKTVQTKLTCHTCGKKNKSLAKFCSQCGTSLEKF